MDFFILDIFLFWYGFFYGFFYMDFFILGNSYSVRACIYVWNRFRLDLPIYLHAKPKSIVFQMQTFYL